MIYTGGNDGMLHAFKLGQLQLDWTTTDAFGNIVPKRATEKARVGNQAIEGCIAQVLQAEREAQSSIESGEGRAAAAIAQARAKARAIAERAEARLAAARQSVEARIARRQAESDRRVRDLQAALAPAEADEGRLDEALARVAASVTTGRAP